MRAVRLERWRGPAALLAVFVVLVTLAVTHRGVPAAEVDLNDGGVWVTNEQLHLAAHLNYPSRTLDGGLRPASNRFDLTQRGNDVLLHDRGSTALTPVDTTQLSFGDGAALGEDYSISQGGDTTAILHSGTGRLWVLPTQDIRGFSPGSDPTHENADGLKATVGVDGIAHALATDGTLHRITVTGGTPAVDQQGVIGDLADFGQAQLSAVGSTPIVLDRAGAALRTARGSTPLPNAAEAVIQQPGETAANAVVASPTALLWAPLAGGTATEQRANPDLPDPGNPVTPVYLDGCAYGAWSGTGAYLRDCLDDSADERATLDRTKAAGKLRFRVNRDVIVLNDAATGLLVLVNDQHRVIDNWQTVQSQVETDDKNNTEQEESSTEQAPEEKNREQRPPIAMPDEFGVRAGRSTTLPVLSNDSSPSGDALTATALGNPRIGTVDRIRGGQALRVAVPDDAQGTDEFSYRADDGRGGSAEAKVRVAVHPPNRNDAPKQLTPATAAVGQGDEVAVAVLPHWIDPNGDDVFLSGATGPEGLSVRYRPDGVVTVRDLGTGSPGVKDVALAVSDGTATAGGVLTVQVKPKSDLPPVANADQAVTWQGQEITIEPLLNDTDPNGTRPRLASVAEPGPGQQVRLDAATGTVSFRAEGTGSYHLDHTITDGPNQATGTIRIDVLAPAPDAPPIADDDIALLSAGGVAVVDVLGNDSDPGGGVLVIQRVDVPADAPISVEIVEQGRLRVSAPAGLPAQASFTYTISNGAGSAEGQVTVLPMPAAATTLPPIATDDTATVRAGDIVSIPALANDSSPTGLPLELRPDLQLVSGDPGGTAFVSGRTIRYRAGQVPGTVRLTYTVTDSAENPASAQVVLTVTAADAANAPPRPEPLVGRVLAGNTVRIPVPLDGIDPDGDSVALTGLGRVPAKGTAEARVAWIEYAAPADATGGDTLSYVVTDRFGQRAEADVRIGIAPPPATNQAPVAVPDELTVRPERQVLTPVLDNDVDPDGDTLALVADSVVPADSETPAGSAFIEGNAVVVETGAAGVRRFFYDVTDGRGGTARGVATVTISPDAPLKAPIARDDVLAAADIVGKDAIEVDVLSNDSDPDGHLADARLEVSEAGATVRGDKITVPVTDQRQVVLYSVVDGDGLAGQAAIIVPAGDRLPPMLIPEKIPAKVKAGEPLRISLGEWVRVREGRTPTLTFAERVTAGPGGDGTPLVIDPTTLQFTPQASFSGRTALSFEVTDGASPEDPEGLSATLSLPIEVEAGEAAQTRPDFRPSQVTVAPLEPAERLDLAAMVTDPDPGDKERMRYALGPVTGDFETRLEGSTLVVSAPDRMPAGTVGTADITVTDGTTEPVTGQVQIRSIASTRPRITVRDVVIPDARAGQPSQIDLTEFITNPFAAENRPVTMVGAPAVTTGDGGASAAGLVVTVTPAANFHGQVVVAYQLADATGDASRQVQGLIRLTVQDRPAPPTDVRALTQASRTATVAWTTGAANGSPITGFTVRHAGGEQPCGMVTTCTVPGLTNDREYTFTVVATNAVGDSDPSAASNMVRPDARPNAPGAPQVTDGDQQVSLTWAPATTEGSPVTSYTVDISPSSGASQREVAGNSLTWTGLTNGVVYTFRVRAHSRAEEPSEWSGYSAQVTPAGLPFAPTRPEVAKQPVSALPPSATVRWAKPSGNGDENLTYQVRRNGSDVVYTGPALTTMVQLANSTEPQTFQVLARNRVGDSQWSSASEAIRAFSNPGAPTGLQVTPTGVNNQVRIQFGAADGNGASPGEMTYSWRANGQGGSIPAGGGTVTSTGGFPNGDPVNVEVYARSTVGGETATGPAANVPRVVAYGPPASPTITCSGGSQAVSCSWSGGAANGRTTSYRLTGDHTATVGAADSYSFTGIGDSATRRLCVQAVQEGGATGTNNCAQATSNPPPPPPPSYGWDRGGRYGPCAVGTCDYVDLTLRNYRPNSQVYCSVPGVGLQNWDATLTVDGSGNWGRGRAPEKPRFGPLLSSTTFSIDPDFGTCSQR